MKERIFKSWETSLVAVALIAGAVALVCFDKATIEQAGVFITVCSGLFFVKNKK